MILGESQLTRIIDTVKASVDNSWVGPLATYGGSPENPQKQVNPIALQVYLSVLVGIIKNMENIEDVAAYVPHDDIISEN